MSEFIPTGITIAVSAAFIGVHLFSRRLHQLLFKSSEVALSFSGGLAVAYVFLNLLPELEKTDRLLGHFASHLISLCGFLFFYGLQQLAWNQAKTRGLKYHQLIFWIQMGFASLYNFLLIYAIPPSLEHNLIWAAIYIIALGLHLLTTDHSYREHFGQIFERRGRFFLVGTLIFGCIIRLQLGEANELFADYLIALLAGFLMFNIFAEELPDHNQTRYGWFVFGALLYVGLLSTSLYLVGAEH